MIIKNMTHKSSGYIIPLSFILLSIAIAIGTALFLRGIIFSSFANIVIKKEKARMLALSGGQIAISQIADRPKKEEAAEKKEGQKAPATDQTNLELLKRLLPIINQWQRFELKESVDGINGEIVINISCQDGKIPINQIIDFAKQQYKGEKQAQGDWKLFMDTVLGNVGKLVGVQDLQSSLINVLKKEQKPPLYEMTQLLAIPSWRVFNGALFPSIAPPGKKVFLMDLLSLENQKPQINPWLMSDSLLIALNLQPPTAEMRAKAAPEWLKNYKGTLKFPDDWKTIFLPMYGKEWQTLPKGSESFFATTFDPVYFCVVSYGKVDDIVQSVFLILERVKQVVKDKTVTQVIIKKAYWL